PARLMLYASDDSDELFVPFRDATSGQETYGAGRYLEIHAHGDNVVIDFNYAYNPNCAYDPAWSCPLPPIENWLKVPIRAGEKAFHRSGPADQNDQAAPSPTLGSADDRAMDELPSEPRMHGVR